MVSWRGVAKKRRKQEAGVRLTKCSLTVAVTQQSWPGGNLYLGLIEYLPFCLPPRPRFRRVRATPCHNLSAMEQQISPADSLRIIA
jgi:hypothetical protein